MMQMLDISDGWELGWCPEPTLNRWLQIYPTWRVEDGQLVGRKELYSAQILANAKPANDLLWQFKMTLGSEPSQVSLLMKYSPPRSTSYQVVFSPGSRLRVYYILLTMHEFTLVEDVGPIIESGVEYSIQCSIENDQIRLLINGELACEFTTDRFVGDRFGFSVDAGQASFRDVQLIDSATGQTIFADDFADDSLKRKVPVALADLTCECWYPAQVPGTVHSSLLAAGVIDDPYDGYHGREATWIDDQRWVYRKTFKVPTDWSEKFVSLDFEGLDYHGYVWLNGELLGYHEGTLNRFRQDITSRIRREGLNELVVCLLPGPTPPHSNVKPYSLQHWHINMDIMTVGIWRPVRLVARDKVSLHDPQVIVRSIENNVAIVEITAQVTASFSAPFDTDYRIEIAPLKGEGESVKQEFQLGYCPGTHSIKKTVRIDNPQLWWPNGMGEQPLYHLAIEVDVCSGWCRDMTGSDRIELDFGVRTLEMRHTPDGQARYPWIFCINGRPFFGKGANWTPVDQMLRLDETRYARMLGRAREAHINMLRPWGGGLIETDEFYRQCDRLGICVMQDFPLANGMFHEIDRSVWREMIRENVTRLRNHPSLALWSGGNEFDPDCPHNKDLIDDLEFYCHEYDPTRDFHRASPYGGDNHSYSVYWLEGMNYTRYSRDLSHAITEFALASPPLMETLKKVIPADELEQWPFCTIENLEEFSWKGYSLATHSREGAYSLHDAHLERLLKRGIPFCSDVGVPKNWDQYIEYFQTAQGIVTQFGIDFWRSRWPYCTATMPWALNSPWPCSLFWDFVDYYGTPKASYYFLKRVYEPIHVGAVFEELFWDPGSHFKAKAFACNDTLEPLSDVNVTLQLYDTSLAPLAAKIFKCNLPPDWVKHCGFFEFPIPMNMPDQVMFLVTSLHDRTGRLLSRGVCTPRVGTPVDKMPYLKDGPWICDVKAHITSLEVSFTEAWKQIRNGRYECVLHLLNTGGKPAYQAQALIPDHESGTSYSDNYFWLDPGEGKDIVVSSSVKNPTIIAKAWNVSAAIELSPASDEDCPVP